MKFNEVIKFIKKTFSIFQIAFTTESDYFSSFHLILKADMFHLICAEK